MAAGQQNRFEFKTSAKKDAKFDSEGKMTSEKTRIQKWRSKLPGTPDRHLVESNCSQKWQLASD